MVNQTTIKYTALHGECAPVSRQPEKNHFSAQRLLAIQHLRLLEDRLDDARI